MDKVRVLQQKVIHYFQNFTSSFTPSNGTLLSHTEVLLSEYFYPALWSTTAFVSCPSFFIFTFILLMEKTEPTLFDSLAITFFFMLGVYAAREQKYVRPYFVTVCYLFLTLQIALVAVVFMILQPVRYKGLCIVAFQYFFDSALYLLVTYVLYVRDLSRTVGNSAIHSVGRLQHL